MAAMESEAFMSKALAMWQYNSREVEVESDCETFGARSGVVSGYVIEGNVFFW